jgi:hypothetical protein
MTQTLQSPNAVDTMELCLFKNSWGKKQEIGHG